MTLARDTGVLARLGPGEPTSTELADTSRETPHSPHLPPVGTLLKPHTRQTHDRAAGCNASSPSKLSAGPIDAVDAAATGSPMVRMILGERLRKRAHASV